MDTGGPRWEDISRGYIGIGAVLVIGFLLIVAALLTSSTDRWPPKPTLARVYDSVAVGT
jgi:hypothetical protein